jgi:hypothetical protein
MNEGLRWTWICIVWMYSSSRLTRSWACTSPISQFWSCEILKWNCQLSHLPAPEHEWLVVSLLPRHKHWDYHRIGRHNHRRFAMEEDIERQTRLQEPELDVRKIVTSLSSITRSEVSPRSCDTCLCSAEYLVNTFIKRDTHKNVSR